MELKNKRALITGGASGMGLAIGGRYLQEGARVVLVDVDAKRGVEAVRALDATGTRAFFCQCDVSRVQDVENTIAEALRSLGGLDIVVNCAGIPLRKKIVDTTPEEWDRVMGVNLRGVYLVCRAAIPHLAPGSCIINIGSVAGLRGLPLRFAYGVSKAGVILMSKQLAIDYAAAGIRVNCICPGGTATPLLVNAALAQGRDPDVALAEGGKAHPLGRLGKPEEIAHAATYLASDLAGFVTGAVLNVDGGVTAG